MRKFFTLSVLFLIINFTIAQNVWDGSTITPVTPNKNIYPVTTGAELAWIAQQCNNGSLDFQGWAVSIEADIDLNNHEWTPIGTESHPFNGYVKGNWKVISNLKISGTNDYVGLFGYIKGYTPNNIVHVSNVFIENVNVSGNNSVGGLVGHAQNYSFDSCYVINGTVSGATGVGGFMGRCVFAAASDCFAKVSVTASVTYGGGFVGINDTADGGSKVFIYYSYAKGQVSGPGINGGFVGLNNSKVKSAYTVTNPISGSTFGGFCGKNSSIGDFDNCYFCTTYNTSITGIGEDLGAVDVANMIGNTNIQMTQDGFVGTGGGNGLNGSDYLKTHWSTDLKSPQTNVNQKHPIHTWYYIIKYDSTASIHPNLTTTSISIYPNPIKNDLYLKIENIKVDKVEIVDLLGKPLITLKNNFEYIDVNQLNNGIYFVKIYSNQEIITRKIIKQ